MSQVTNNLRRVRELIVGGLEGRQLSCAEERIDDRVYSWEIYSLPCASGSRLIALQIISRRGVSAAGNISRGEVEHFDVWMPMVHTNSMDDTFDALRLFRDCPTEDSGWLHVVRRLRQKTAAIKDVLLGPWIDGRQLNRDVDKGITNGSCDGDDLARWEQVLQLALIEKYKEPGHES